jgi:hypothetical protein
MTRKVGTAKRYKADFYVATHNDEREHPKLVELLDAGIAAGGYTEAIELDPGSNEWYQVRSIVKVHRVYRGVFGRSRYGEKPLQGTVDGREADVDLKPGHGLVEKNYFLFYADRNLIVYQRNASGSHYSRFQRYARSAIGGNVTFEPVLTRDSYVRLLAGGQPRSVELSFQSPKDPTVYQDLFFGEAARLVRRVGGTSASIRISTGRSAARLTQIKNSVVEAAKLGIARVARVQLEDEADPIDLIADRITQSITVPLQANGRPDSEAVYAALAQAEIERGTDLAVFFGSAH